MKQKLFTLLAFMVISVAVFGQARPGSRFFQTTSVRMCQKEVPGKPLDCRDFENGTVWQVTNDLQYVKMISDGSTSTMYIVNVEHEDETGRYFFICRDLNTNMIYDFMLDFNLKTIFLLDRSDETSFIFYWSKLWEDENAY